MNHASDEVARKPKPSLGRVVLLATTAGPGYEEPATISKVWSDTCVNLHVMQQDTLTPIRLETSRLLDESETPAPGTWHWPPRV